MPKGSYIPEFNLRDNVNGLSPPLTVYAVQHTDPVNTVAVLPFKNLSGLPENDFMVDGFCEQLSADLAIYPENCCYFLFFCHRAWNIINSVIFLIPIIHGGLILDRSLHISMMVIMMTPLNLLTASIFPEFSGNWYLELPL